MEQEKTKARISIRSLKEAIGLFKYLLPYKGYFYGAMFLLIIGSLMMMIIMGIPGEMVNAATGGKTRFPFNLNQWGVIMFAVLAVRAVLSFVQTILFANASEKAMADVRKDLYKKLISQEMSYFEQYRVGELTSRITADVEQLQSVFSITLAEFIRQILVLIFGVAVLAFLMPRLFLVMLLTLPVVVVLAMSFGRYIRKLSKKRQEQLAVTNTIVEETLQNFNLVKAFGNERFEWARFGVGVMEMVDISLRFARIRGLFFAFIIFLLFGSVLFILWRGAYLVQSGQMEAGNLLSFVIYTVMIGGAIASLGSLYTTIAGALGATERVKEMLQRPTELNIEIPEMPLRLKGQIEFQNAWFNYPSRPELSVMKGVDLKIEQGSKVALVGQSGSGKTTLIKLLMRFYELDKGDILFDGTSIRAIDLKQLRSNFGIVPQEVILFGGTIRENMLYGKPDATEEELIEAARQSYCLDFIRQFPDGFETIVGERGVKLSGGQKQRIAIARMILRNPSILLLDEATSSLDAESEKTVQDAMDTLMENRTSIIVAHRLSTIRNVDCIYVLDNGQIVESGNHLELLERENGIYKNLAKLQFDIS